jgi:hypothetical protein
VGLDGLFDGICSKKQAISKSLHRTHPISLSRRVHWVSESVVIVILLRTRNILGSPQLCIVCSTLDLELEIFHPVLQIAQLPQILVDLKLAAPAEMALCARHLRCQFPSLYCKFDGVLGCTSRDGQW